jgi:hypothetical protein
MMKVINMPVKGNEEEDKKGDKPKIDKGSLAMKQAN